MAVSQPVNVLEIVIEPTRGLAGLRLREVWRERELLAFLAWRDVAVRYRQTLLGAAWALLQPLATMAIFSLVFGRFARLPSGGSPYALFALCGLVPWQCFATGLGGCANSLTGNAALLTKVYFPRLVLPLASLAPALVDLGVSLVALAAGLLLFGPGLTPRALLVPLFAPLPLLPALGAGLWLAALGVRYRDVRHVLPFVTQFWLFASPVAYPTDLLPAALRPWFALNPMVAVIDLYRWALLGHAAPTPAVLAVSGSVALVLLGGGALFFRRQERGFADVV